MRGGRAPVVLAAALAAHAVLAATGGGAFADPLPAAQWDDEAERAEAWSRATLEALRGHGEPLVAEVPDDIHRWCPAYDDGTDRDRRAFWLGLVSTLSHYESTWQADAVGGDGQYFGLLQIAPGTAEAYECRAQSGEALKEGPANLSCGIRIMSETVPRDGVVARGPDGPGGVAADWGPMTSAEKRGEMRDWLRQQEYCQTRVSLVPTARTLADREGAASGRPAPRPGSGGFEAPTGQALAIAAEPQIPAPRVPID